MEEPLGEMIEVDGHNMCIYSEGKGEHTLVFFQVQEPLLLYLISEVFIVY